MKRNQKITAAARVIAWRKTVCDLRQRVEMSLRALSLPNILSMRLRRLQRRLPLAQQGITNSVTRGVLDGLFARFAASNTGNCFLVCKGFTEEPLVS